MICRFCGSENQESSVFCGQCGSRIAAEAKPENPAPAGGQASYFDASSAEAPKSKRNIKPLIFVAIGLAIAAVIGMSALGQLSNNSTAAIDESTSVTDQVTEEPQLDTSWVPAGYTWHSDDFAIKWVTNQGDWPCSDCNFWKLKIVPHYDCSNGVYGEINMLDSSDTVVDWTNDTIPSLAAGQTGLLVFENYPFDDNIDSGQITELTCNY